MNHKKLAMHYQMDGALNPRPKRGPDVKIIIQSLKMEPVLEHSTSAHRAIACNPARMFKSVIQRANDSGSMDTSLEFKPLSKTVQESGMSQHKKVPYVEELREILKEKTNIQLGKVQQTNAEIGTPSKIPFANRKNLPYLITEELKNKKPKLDQKSVPKMCEKFLDTIKLSKKMPVSSTPYRTKHTNETNNNCKGEINLMTPSADVRFIDSDVDTNDGDFNRTLVKCFSLTRASCRRMASFRKNLRKQDSQSDILMETSPTFERRSLFTSSFHGTSNRSSIVSANEISPLRRQKNVKFKNSKLLNFFRSSKINVDNDESLGHESDLTQTCNNLSQLLAKSDQHFEDLGCAPLLTKDNLDFYADNNGDLNDCDRTLDWRNKFEFSYICEPSTSDIGEEDELENYAKIANETESMRVPSLKMSSPSKGACNIHCTKKHNTTHHNKNSSPFRRSVSDPALIRLATINRRSTFGLNIEADFNDPLDFYNCMTENIVSGSCISEHQLNSYSFKYRKYFSLDNLLNCLSVINALPLLC